MSDRRGPGFWDYEKSKPRRVDGGLKARSTRGAIGSSWWSRRFIAVLESFALGTRLTRGRSYARSGQVVTLDVAPGVVTAVVQGSRPKPYQVRVQFPPITEKVWAALEIALSAQAVHSAALLAGEVPAELEQVVSDCGDTLFPRTIRDLSQQCSCPDGAVPCKHLAATFYLLAEAFDSDPFLILTWRGREKQQLLNRLRELRSGDSAAPVAPDIGAAPQIGAALALTGLRPAPTDWDEFWYSPVPLDEAPATLDVQADLLLRQLPDPGAELGGAAFVERLRGAYLRMAAPDPPPGPEPT